MIRAASAYCSWGLVVELECDVALRDSVGEELVDHGCGNASSRPSCGSAGRDNLVAHARPEHVLGHVQLVAQDVAPQRASVGGAVRGV